jgi:hypothetical protein
MSKNIKSVIHVNENFTIRKIIPKEIASRYFKGEFDNRSLPDFKIKTSNALVKLGKDIGKDAASEVYRFIDRGNNNQTILTTNHSLYKYSIDLYNGKTPDCPIVKCKYCKRTILKKPIGLPISMNISEDEVSFTVIDSYCDFGCAFSNLKRKNCESRLYRGPLYMNAEQLLYCMFYRMYPDRIGQSIKEKPDWDLLRENGGSLTDGEFDSEISEYVSIPSLIILPSKKQYLKLHLKSARKV